MPILNTNPKQSMSRALPAKLMCLLAFTFFCAQTHAQALPAALQSFWQRAQVEVDRASILVREVGGAVPLVSVNPQVPRNPASVMKLVTTWAGLSGLGANWRWRTELLAGETAHVDARGRLSGALYLRAGGDPALTVEALWRLLRDLRLRGVAQLDELVVDRSIFGQVAIDPDAFDAAGDRPYNASPDAMMVNWGAVRIAFFADARARQWRPVLDPPVSGVSLSGTLDWAAGACPDDPKDSKVQVNRMPAHNVQVVQVDGKMQVAVSGVRAGACGNFSVYRLLQPQEQHFGLLFRTLWQELGGTLGRDFNLRSGPVPDRAQVLVWHDSPPLSEVIRSINKYSNNVMARMLLLTLGAWGSDDAGGERLRMGEQQAGATASSSAAWVMRWLRGQGVDTRGWRIANGSGLSRRARLTASGLAGMLDVAWQSSLMPEFVSSLSIAGIDGTLQDRLRTEQTQGAAHLKTGTLRDAQALAGYVLATSGKRYIVVCMVNSTDVAGVQQFHDALITWVRKQ